MADSGWDGPVAVDYRFYLPEFSSAMKAGHDRSGIGRRSSKLRDALGLGHLKVSKGKDGIPTGITISAMPVYARIQDVGGEVRSRPVGREMAPGRYMHFNAYGKEWFMKRVAGFTLPGYQYIQHGLDVVGERLGLIFEPRWKKR